MKKGVVVALVGVAAVVGAVVIAHAAKPSGPKFVDYPVAVSAPAKRPPLQLNSVDARQEQAELEQAYRGPVNFAGHYVFAVLSAGDNCETGAAINTLTGYVHMFGLFTCGWRASDRTPFYVRGNSRLLVVSGRLGGQGKLGAHYFLFDEGRLVALEPQERRIELDPDTAAYLGKAGRTMVEDMEPEERKAVLERIAPEVREFARDRHADEVAQIEPAAGPDEFSPEEIKLGEKMKEGVETAESNPDTAPYWSCFSNGLKQSSTFIRSKSKDENAYYFNIMGLGGFTSIGDRVRVTCNKTLNENGYGKNEEAIKSVNRFFVMMLIMQEKQFYDACDAKEGASWHATKVLCTMKRKKFEEKLNSI